MDITVESIVFLIFGVLTLSSALLMVTSRNLFHGALYLMVSLFGVAGLFALLAAPFLAGVQVVVYIGAIAILIIFAIMLTPQVTAMRRVRTSQWPVAVAVAVIFFLLLVSVVTPLMDELGVDNFAADFTQDAPQDVPDDSLVQLGEQLVDPQRFMLPFEVASVLLMAALIGAVLLVWPESKSKPAVPSGEAGDD